MTKDNAKKLLQAVPPLAYEFLKGVVKAVGYYLTNQLLK